MFCFLFWAPYARTTRYKQGFFPWETKEKKALGNQGKKGLGKPRKKRLAPLARLMRIQVREQVYGRSTSVRVRVPLPLYTFVFWWESPTHTYFVRVHTSIILQQYHLICSTGMRDVHASLKKRHSSVQAQEHFCELLSTTFQSLGSYLCLGQKLNRFQPYCCLRMFRKNRT